LSWCLKPYARRCAQVIVLNHPTRIFPGYTPTLCCHTGYVACRFAELHARIDRKTGQVVDKRPQSLQNGDAAFVRLVPLGPLCVEAFVQCAMLGRFVLRDNQQTVAVGMVKSVTHKR
jgi:elongation factor 1-alpha